MGASFTLSFETEEILHTIEDSYKQLDILIEKYNFVEQKNIILLEEIDILKSEIFNINDKNIATTKMLKDYEAKIQELEKNNIDLENELKLKSNELETIQGKYNIKTINLVNLIQEKDEIIEEKEEAIKRLSGNIDRNKDEKAKEINELLSKIEEMQKTILKLSGKKSYVESFNQTNELLKSDIKLKIDQTIEKINSLIS
jgi:chromosome segregation ATPase